MILNSNWTRAAVTPLYGQLANIYGRRWIMISAVAIFVLGNGLCGGANSSAMLIAGRCVMGIGTGGLTMMLELIVSDLVPVRKRAPFMGIIFAAINVGTALGPFVGGQLVSTTTWRWVFYMNIPIGGTALLLLIAFLQTSYKGRMTLAQSVRRIDFVGNILIMASSVSILFALTYGGARYSWSSWHTAVPLALGLVGLVVFVIYEAFVPKEPVMPLRLFTNRTSATAFFLTFIFSLLNLWRIYFLSVYFQSTLLSSPARAGVQILPSVLMLLPAVLIAGGFVNKTGRYRPVHFFGFGLLTLGQGLLVLLGSNSPPAAWIIIQMVVAFGSSSIVSALLPAVQAGLSEADTAAATATSSFIRAFGVIWGVTIPTVIFNNRFNQLSGRITDVSVRNIFAGGRAYELASKDFIKQFPQPTRDQIISVYQDSLRRGWQISTIFAGVAFLAVFLEKEIVLRTKLETEYGMKKKKNADSERGKASGMVENRTDELPVPAPGSEATAV